MEKLYRVSLACAVPVNFDKEVYASSEKEALEKALEFYQNSSWDGTEFGEEDYSEVRLDIRDKRDGQTLLYPSAEDIDHLSGVDVQELQ